MSDLISRQAAIDAVCEGCLRKEYQDKHGCLEKECGAKNRLEALPSAEKTEWIPVSDARPPLGAIVIVQFERYDEIAVTTYGGVRWNNDKPVAWMPLPEPYKGGDTE